MAIQKGIPGFDTSGFIVAGVSQLLSGFNGEASVGAAFRRTIDDILWKESQKPNPCGSSATMVDNVTTIAKALGRARRFIAVDQAPAKPRAVSAARMCGGTGALTWIAGRVG